MPAINYLPTVVVSPINSRLRDSRLRSYHSTYFHWTLTAQVLYAGLRFTAHRWSFNGATCVF